MLAYAPLGPTTDPDANSAIPLGVAMAAALVPDNPPRIP